MLNINITFLIKDYKVTYQYDTNKNRYNRIINGIPHVDLNNNEQLTAGNVVVLGADHKVLDDEGRLQVTLMNSGPALLYQNGIREESRMERGSERHPDSIERASSVATARVILRMYAKSGVAARCFQQAYCYRLWHLDIKYGPNLPIGTDGAMKQVFLVTLIDDATRIVLHGDFYPVMDKSFVAAEPFRSLASSNLSTSTTAVSYEME